MLNIRVEAATALAYLADTRAIENTPVFSALNTTHKFRVCKLPEFFTTSAGDDVELCVAGTFSAPERNCGWTGNFDITRVWLPSDPTGTDIHSLLTQLQIDRIEQEGFERGAYPK